MLYQRHTKSRDLRVKPVRKLVVWSRLRQLLIFHMGLFSLFGGIFTPFHAAVADSTVIPAFIDPSDGANLSAAGSPAKSRQRF